MLFHMILLVLCIIAIIINILTLLKKINYDIWRWSVLGTLLLIIMLAFIIDNSEVAMAWYTEHYDIKLVYLLLQFIFIILDGIILRKSLKAK